MKTNNTLFGLLCVLILTAACEPHNKKEKEDAGFSFVFLTDIHLQKERGAYEAFQHVIDTVNQLEADFVMTGGDLVYDVLRGNLQRSDSLFMLYKTSVRKINKHVYHTMGNHEVFGVYPESDIDSLHPDYKFGLFERHLGKTYYSFDHKGWHFMVLRSVMVKDQEYYGMIDEEQKTWIEQEIAALSPETPIALVTHVPFASAFHHYYKNAQLDKPNRQFIFNREEILSLFENHNLKLVLQGHLHWLEDINMQGKIRFITGGAVAGRPTWRGTKYNEEGFLHIQVSGDEEITWKYIDYGWEARP